MWATLCTANEAGTLLVSWWTMFQITNPRKSKNSCIPLWHFGRKYLFFLKVIPTPYIKWQGIVLDSKNVKYRAVFVFMMIISYHIIPWNFLYVCNWGMGPGFYRESQKCAILCVRSEEFFSIYDLKKFVIYIHIWIYELGWNILLHLRVSLWINFHT